jgi:membrane protein YqaA with SNARE-associated domain
MIAALALVALWAFAEAILFFIVADVPISYVALRYGWRRGIFAAVIAAVMAGLGGVALILCVQWGILGFKQMIAALPAIDTAMMRDAADAFSDDGYWAMAKGAFSGIPYKLYAYAAAPAPPGGLFTFFIASFLARLPRFMIVALGISGIGHMLSRRIVMRGRLVILALMWAGFYSGYFANMPA